MEFYTGKAEMHGLLYNFRRPGSLQGAHESGGGREACRARTKAAAAGKPVGRARKRRRPGSLQGAHESGGGRENKQLLLLFR